MRPRVPCVYWGRILCVSSLRRRAVLGIHNSQPIPRPAYQTDQYTARSTRHPRPNTAIGNQNPTASRPLCRPGFRVRPAIRSKACPALWQSRHLSARTGFRVVLLPAVTDIPCAQRVPAVQCVPGALFDSCCSWFPFLSWSMRHSTAFSVALVRVR